jgi:hypothetical protein
MAMLGVHKRVFWVELHSLEGCMMVLEQVDYKKVLEVVDHRKALELEICMIVSEAVVAHRRVLEIEQVLVVEDHKMVLVSSYKMALVVYRKVLVQVDSEMAEHRMVFEQEDYRKASLVAPSLMEQHRWASYQEVEVAYSSEHWHCMAGIPEEASVGRAGEGGEAS